MQHADLNQQQLVPLQNGVDLQKQKKQRHAVSVSMKLTIVAYATTNGIGAAIRQWPQFHLQRSQLKKWIAARSILEQASPDASRLGSGRTPVYPALEKELLQWIRETGETNRQRIHDKAREVAASPAFQAQNPGMDSFKCSLKWVNNVLRRNGLKGTDDNIVLIKGPDASPVEKRPRGRPKGSGVKQPLLTDGIAAPEGATATPMGVNMGMPGFQGNHMPNAVRPLQPPSPSMASGGVRMIKCEMCQNLVRANSLEAHMNSECTEANQLVACSMGCGQSCIRRLLAEHIDRSCPMAAVSCEFNAQGCNALIRRQEVNQHMHNEAGRHVALLRTVYTRQLEAMQQENQSLKKSIEMLEQQLAACRNAIAEVESLAGIITVHVSLPTKDTIALKVRTSETVQALKDKIGRAREGLGLAMERHVLVCKDGEMQGPETLEAHHLTSECNLVLRLKTDIPVATSRRPQPTPLLINERSPTTLGMMRSGVANGPNQTQALAQQDPDSSGSDVDSSDANSVNGTGASGQGLDNRGLGPNSSAGAHMTMQQQQPPPQQQQQPPSSGGNWSMPPMRHWGMSHDVSQTRSPTMQAMMPDSRLASTDSRMAAGNGSMDMDPVQDRMMVSAGMSRDVMHGHPHHTQHQQHSTGGPGHEEDMNDEQIGSGGLLQPLSSYRHDTTLRQQQQQQQQQQQSRQNLSGPPPRLAPLTEPTNLAGNTGERHIWW